MVRVKLGVEFGIREGSSAGTGNPRRLSLDRVTKRNLEKPDKRLDRGITESTTFGQIPSSQFKVNLEEVALKRTADKVRNQLHSFN